MKDWLYNILHNFATIFVQALFWILFFINPISTSMWIIIFLIGSDLIFGTWASLKEGDEFSSRSLRRTAGKIFVYEFLLIFSLILEENVFQDYPLIKGCMSLLSVVESISILENISRITGIDFFEFLFHKINKNSDSGKFLFKLRQKSYKKKSKKP